MLIHMDVLQDDHIFDVPVELHAHDTRDGGVRFEVVVRCFHPATRSTLDRLSFVQAPAAPPDAPGEWVSTLEVDGALFEAIKALELKVSQVAALLDA